MEPAVYLVPALIIKMALHFNLHYYPKIILLMLIKFRGLLF